MDKIARIINPWRSIIIHHSLTKDSGTVSWAAIRNYHINVKKWDYIGYHFGVEMINDGYEILVGRPLDIPGAHTRGKNRSAIGVCCVGNYDITGPSLNMVNKLARFLASLVHVLKIPVTEIKGHRNFAEKTCPGNKFDLGYLKAVVESYLI